MKVQCRKRISNASSQFGWVKYTKHWPCAPMYGRLYHYAGNNPVRYIDPDGREASIVADSNAKTVYISYQDMMRLWSINNQEYNYSKSIRGIFEIGKAAFDNGLMVGETLELFSNISKSIFNYMGKSSTVLSLVLSLLPDPKGEIKKEWDAFLADYVDAHNGKIDPEIKDIRMTISTTSKRERYCEQRGLYIVSGERIVKTRKTILDFYVSDTKKGASVTIKTERWQLEY